MLRKGVKIKQCVNALYRAFSISTKKYFIEDAEYTLCQCPLSGFLHFYTERTVFMSTALSRCQCPLSGFLHFYAFHRKENDLWKKSVNALYRAFSISTVPHDRRNYHEKVSVNALYRAFSISTKILMLE